MYVSRSLTYSRFTAVAILDIANVKVNSTTEFNENFSKNNVKDGQPDNDGAGNYEPDTCSCCYASKRSASSWLELDLLEFQLVSRIVIFGRKDRKFIFFNAKRVIIYLAATILCRVLFIFTGSFTKKQSKL